MGFRTADLRNYYRLHRFVAWSPRATWARIRSRLRHRSTSGWPMCSVNFHEVMAPVATALTVMRLRRRLHFVAHLNTPGSQCSRRAPQKNPTLVLHQAQAQPVRLMSSFR